MCGILGIVNPAGHPSGVSQTQLIAMRDLMASRGPDGAGLFQRGSVAFAHRRLAIRDRLGGSQPWLSEDEQLVLVYNGELYNDDELRSELESEDVCFRSACDTEVVMAAYQRWGTDCVSRLRGMFAFGIYDFRDKSLFLVRDRFGVKPLYLTRVDGGLTFASTVACLLAHPHVRKQANWSVISHYLSTLRLTLGRETVFEGIWQLLPGEMLRYCDGEVTIQRYWDYPVTETEGMEYEDALVTLDRSLESAVTSRLRSDVPVGLFLSGGVDSSTIACQVRRHETGPMLAQCGGGSTDDSPDFEFASRCSRHLGFDFQEVRVSHEEYLERWQQLISQCQTPLATPSDVIIHSLARHMKESVGVVLGGEGADELLCGYSVQHWAGHDYDRSRALSAGDWKYGTRAATEFADSLQQQYGRESFSCLTDHYFALNSLIPTVAKPALFQPWSWRHLAEDRPMWDYYAAQLHAVGEVPASRKYLRLLHQVNLESLLARLDTATMQASLEARVPFTDHQLVENMFRLPEEHKIAVDPGERSPYLASGQLESRGSLHSKRVLRSLAERLMPKSLAQRKKASFPTPVQGWLRGPWRHWAAERLRESPFARAVFQRESIDQLTANVGQAGMWLWPLLNVTMWGDAEFG